MAYEKQTWQTGDVITQEKLNHMEDGIEDAGGEMMVLHFPVSQDPNGDDFIGTQITGLPYTAEEMVAAAKKGTLVGQIDYTTEYYTKHWCVNVVCYVESAYPTLEMRDYELRNIYTDLVTEVRAFVASMNPDGTFNITIKTVPFGGTN